MKKEEIYEKLYEVFKDVFDDDSINLNDETTSDDIEEWDSLEHVNLIVAIEKCFNMKFSMGEVVNMRNVGEMVNIIMERVK